MLHCFRAALSIPSAALKSIPLPVRAQEPIDCLVFLEILPQFVDTLCPSGTLMHRETGKGDKDGDADSTEAIEVGGLRLNDRGEKSKDYERSATLAMMLAKLLRESRSQVRVSGLVEK